ncbi:MAG: hypothetical protein D6755_13105 [Anaerolineae bacterium]|nr:MAG: hypothetical protein D6755_13105 [Anaerolineae bacterium]
MCGMRFTPHAEGACAGCPLNGGCRLLACCPNCGYEVVDTRESLLARWAGKLLRRPQTTDHR